MKGSEQFKTAIQNYLNQTAASDKLFAKTLKKENKNIDDCITYILHRVKESGKNGFADEEIYQIAAHYYDEDDIMVGKPISAKVVVSGAINESKKSRAKKAQVSEKPKIIKLENNKQVSLFDFPGV